MANQFKVMSSNIKTGEVDQLIQFFNGETSTQVGEWAKMGLVHDAILQIRGITTGTVQVWGINPGIDANGNVEALPSDETGAEQIGANITADGIVSYEGKELPMYVKVKITVDTIIALDAVMRVRKQGKGIA